MGTVSGSNSWTRVGSTGTQTRPVSRVSVGMRGLWMDGILSCARMDTKWRFEQMVSVLGDFGIEARVGILEGDVFD